MKTVAVALSALMTLAASSALAQEDLPPVSEFMGVMPAEPVEGKGYVGEEMGTMILNQAQFVTEYGIFKYIGAMDYDRDNNPLGADLQPMQDTEWNAFRLRHGLGALHLIQSAGDGSFCSLSAEQADAMNERFAESFSAVFERFANAFDFTIEVAQPSPHGFQWNGVHENDFPICGDDIVERTTKALLEEDPPSVLRTVMETMAGP